MTAVRAAAAASPPLPLRGSHRRGRRVAAAPTRVVDVQLVRDALVAPSKDDHQLPDSHGPVSVPGAGDRPREGGNPPPVEEAGSRHLPNPRPSAHNAPRPLRRLRSRGRAGTRLQLCAGGGGSRDRWRPGPGWRPAGRGGVPAGEPRPRLRATCPGGARLATGLRLERPFLPTESPAPSPRTGSPPLLSPPFCIAGESTAFAFTATLIEHLGCPGESGSEQFTARRGGKLA